LKVGGSRLFEELEKTGGALQAQSETAAVLDLTMNDENASPLATLTGITGVFVKGITQVSYRGGLSNSPFSISYGPFGPTSCNFNVKVELTKWEGRPLLSLPYFDQLLRFFRNSVPAKSIESHWSVDGNSVARIKSAHYPGEFFKLYADFLSYLDRMRVVCKKLDVSPLLDLDRACESKGALEEAFTLLNDGELSRPISGSFTLTVNDLSTDLDLADGKTRSYRVAVPTVCEIMGESVTVGVVDNYFTEMVVERQRVVDERTVELVLSPTPKSVHIRKLASEC
jgi:hypothetical protein